MSKKHRKISLAFIAFLLTLLTIVSFAEPPEAPNQLITENPYKEVKTVEANKNREHAEMNISVNKLNPKVLNGYKLSDTEYYIELPSEEILKQNETYYISKTFEDLPDIYSVNGKKTIVNLNKFENYSMETADFNYGFADNIILIDKAPLDIKNFIISKLDKTSGEIKKIYEVKDIKNVNINKLYGEWSEKSEYITFALNEEIVKELTAGSEIKIGKNFSEILKNENTRKRNKRNSELFYKIDKEKKQLLVENREDVNEIKILTLNNEKINKVYTGNKTREYEGQIMDFKGKPIGYRIISSFNKNNTNSLHINGINQNFLRWNGFDLGQGIYIYIDNSGQMYYEKKESGIVYYGEIRDKWIGYQTTDGANRAVTIKLKNDIFTMGDVNIILKNPLVSGTIGQPPGRIRIYSRSSEISIPEIGNLNNSDNIITTNIKNGQYKLSRASGKYMPILPNQLGGDKVDITINTGDGDFKKINDIYIVNSNAFNGMMSTAYNGGRGGIEVGVDYQESGRSNYGTDISLTNWDLEAKNIKVTMKHPWIGNNFNITVPEFSGEVYYNDLISQIKPTEIDYSNKTVKGFFVREHSGEMKFKFNIGTKDYDLRILGNDNGKINLSIKIPKQVILEVIDSLGNKQSLPFVTEVTASTGVLGEDANYYYIHAPNDGWTFNSAISGVVTLKTMYKRNISVASVNGTNLNLISIGAKSSRTGKEKRTTIVDKVDLKVELANFNEIIDVSSLKALEKKYTTQGFYGLIQNENRIVLKEGETEIFATTFEMLKATPQLVIDAGINIGYSEMENKFEFTKERYVNYNKNLKLEIKTSSGLLLYVIDLNIINEKLETNSTVTYNPNNFALMQIDTSAPYGRLRVSTTSNVDLKAKIGILDTTNYVVTTDKKNGQFLQPKIEGDTYPLQPHHFGKSVFITVGSNRRDVKISNDINGNPIDTHSFTNQNGITTFVDYEALSISKGAIDFGFTEWNGEGQSIPMKVEYPDGAISNYTLNIPEFEGKNYYNEELPLANEYLPTKKYKKEINEFMSGELDRIKLGTKNYDLRILGTDGSGNSNLRIKVPKEIELTAVSNENNENIQKLKFSITLENIENGTKSDDGNYYIVKPNNNGYRDANSEMTFDVVLTGAVVRNFEVNNLVSLRGDLDLVSIGAVNPGTGMNKMTTIINQVEYKINFKNSSETIDFRDKNKGDIILGNTQFEALDTNKIDIKNKGVTILSGSILEFKKGVELPETGVKISYSPAERRLKFEKIGYKDYSNENLVLELRSKENLLLRVISLKLYNKAGFEILPGKGTLEFGDFFPGDFRSASSLIEFKNPTGAKLEITLDVNNRNEMYKTTATAITANTKIPLTNVRISDFKGTGNINSFIISGDAKTSKTTEIGIYKGELNVIITIIP